jgi:hypothetical protein
MNKTSLSLCLFGAALATANILIIQRPTCPSGGTEVAAADKDAPSTQTEVISTVKRKPPQAAKAAVSTAEAKPPDASAQAKPSQALKAAAKPSGPAPKDDVTGSVKQTAKTQEPNDEKPAVSPAQLAKSGLGPARDGPGAAALPPRPPFARPNPAPLGMSAGAMLKTHARPLGLIGWDELHPSPLEGCLDFP